MAALVWADKKLQDEYEYCFDKYHHIRGQMDRRLNALKDWPPKLFYKLTDSKDGVSFSSDLDPMIELGGKYEPPSPEFPNGVVWVTHFKLNMKRGN